MSENTNTGSVSCAVCGARFETVAESMNHDHLKSDYQAPADNTETFETIWKMEALAKGNKDAKATLYAMIDTLTPSQAMAYGEFRYQKA